MAILIHMASLVRNAYAIALFLEGHKAVSKVSYPGLPSHPQHEIAKRQQHGFGAMITFYCVGGREQSRVILQKVSVFGGPT
jgi:cystathionine beta-lyase/cystathionine gamma-synthase